jgi:hypothetical protein
MIRAELNVKIAAHIRDSRKVSFFRKLLSRLIRTLLGGLEENENIFKSMSFEDYMVTLINWRKVKILKRRVFGDCT